MNIIDLSTLTTKLPKPGKVMIDEALLIPSEWRALVRKLLPGRKVELTLASGLHQNSEKIYGRATWVRGNYFEIQMAFEFFRERSLEASFETFLHEIAHLKWTSGQSSSHIHRVFLKMIPDDELTEIIGKGTDDPKFPTEYVANKQRDLWLQEAEEAVGKDAPWEEKARYLST